MKVTNGEYPVSPLYPIPAAHALFIYKDRPIALFPLAWLSAPEATRFRPMRVELVAKWMARFGISDVYEINEYPTKLRVPYILYLDLVRKSGIVQLWYGNPVQELGSPYTHYIGPFVSRAEADQISEFYNFYGRIRRRNEDLSANVIQGSEEVDRQSPG